MVTRSFPGPIAAPQYFQLLNRALKADRSAGFAGQSISASTLDLGGYLYAYACSRAGGEPAPLQDVHKKQ